MIPTLRALLLRRPLAALRSGGPPGPGRSVSAPGSRLAVALALAAVCLGLTACGAAERLERPPGAAVWVTTDTPGLAPGDLRSLARAGLREVFCEAAVLEGWNGDTPRLVPTSLVDSGRLPRRTPVSLVVTGAWSGAVADPEAAAAALVPDLAELRLDAEAAGLLPVGFHLQLDAVSDLSGYASFAAALARRLPPDLQLSLGFEPAWLEAGAAEALARAPDFLVAFLHGQRSGEIDEPERWDPDAVIASLERLDRLGGDYLLALSTVGSATLLDGQGEVREATTRLALESLVTNPALALAADDILAGGAVGRLVYTFDVERATRVGEWPVERGESVRLVVFPAALAQRLDRDLRERALDHYLGPLFHRLPVAGEGLALGPRDMVAALDSQPVEPDLDVRLVVESRSSSRAVVSFDLVNRSSVPTDVSLAGGNYVELQLDGGYFTRFERGEFLGHGILVDGREIRSELAAGWREPDGARFFVPMVGSEASVDGGGVEIRLRGGEANLTVGGHFFLQDGREIDLEPRRETL